MIQDAAQRWINERLCSQNKCMHKMARYDDDGGFILLVVHIGSFQWWPHDSSIMAYAGVMLLESIDSHQRIWVLQLTCIWLRIFSATRENQFSLCLNLTQTPLSWELLRALCSAFFQPNQQSKNKRKSQIVKHPEKEKKRVKWML